MEEDDVLHVVIEFTMRGSDELDNGENIAHPYSLILEGDEAEAIQRYLKKGVPDLLDAA